MADIAEDQLDDDFAETGGQAVQGAGAPPPSPPTSPLIRLIESLKGGGKNKKTSSAPLPALDAKGPEGPSPEKETLVSSSVSGGRPAVQMPAGALVTVVTRNEFYRDGFRRLLWISLVEAIIIVCLLVAFISFVTTGQSQDRYFATTADGRIMQLAPLDQPGNMSTAALMSWVALATSEVMSFGYNDYQRRLQQSSRHFTHRGWETFTGALQTSKILDGMLGNKEVLTASPRAAPVLVQEGVINGKYRWIVKLQLQVDYDSQSGTSRKSNLNVTLVIERVPSLENPSGIGIEQWISTQG